MRTIIPVSVIAALWAFTVCAPAQDLRYHGIPNLRGVELPKYIALPMAAPNGQELLIPLNIAPLTSEKKSALVSELSNRSFSRANAEPYAWHLFPLTDASRTILFNTSAAEVWTFVQ